MPDSQSTAKWKLNLGSRIDGTLEHFDQKGAVYVGVFSSQTLFMALLEGFYSNVFKTPTWWTTVYLGVLTGFVINGTVKSTRNVVPPKENKDEVK